MKSQDPTQAFILSRHQMKKDKLENEVTTQAETMKQTLSKILKNPEIKKALDMEKNDAIRRHNSGGTSPLERAMSNLRGMHDNGGFYDLERGPVMGDDTDWSDDV